jgi:hypothetical protein
MAGWLEVEVVARVVLRGPVYCTVLYLKHRSLSREGEGRALTMRPLLLDGDLAGGEKRRVNSRHNPLFMRAGIAYGT